MQRQSGTDWIFVALNYPTAGDIRIIGY